MIVQTPETDTGAATPMPRYRCHKEVWALKIAKFEPVDDPVQNGVAVGGFITPADPGYARFAVSYEYVQKHHPQAGGYFVQYDDGYCSWSPADAFDSGYTRI
jgi:hypothetical protein